MNGVSKQFLIDNGYQPRSQDIFVNENYFNERNISIQEFFDKCLVARNGKDKKIVEHAEAVYKYCTYYKCYLNINEFSAVKGKDNLIFSSLSLRGDNERSKKRVKEFNDINYPIMRLWFNGDPNKKLECLVTGKILEDVTEFNESIGEHRTYNLFHLHHILTVFGYSVHKIDTTIQPSYLLGKRDLRSDDQQPHLIDLMNTVCIGSDEHDKVHCSSRQSDIKYWSGTRNALPWGLRSKDNFNHFCNLLKLDLQYDKFVYCQTLDWYEKNKESIDLKKDPQDIQQYLERFK